MTVRLDIEMSDKIQVAQYADNHWVPDSAPATRSVQNTLQIVLRVQQITQKGCKKVISRKGKVLTT